MGLDQLAFLSAGGALVLGAFLLTQWVTRARDDAAAGLLGWLILVCTLNAAHPALIRWTGVGPAESGAFFEPMQFLLAPVLAAYASAALRGQFPWRAARWGHLVPFGLAVAVSSWFSVRGSTPPLVPVAFWGLLTVQMLVYLIPALQSFHRYQQSLPHRVSNLAPVDLGWLQRFFWVALGLTLTAGLVLLLLLHDLHPDTLGPLVSTALIGALWVLGTRGLEHRLPPREEPQDEGASPGRPPLGPREAQRLAQDLRLLFERDKPHRDPDLDLAGLAARMGVARNALSFVLNSELGATFYDWVNGWRVQEFRALAADPERDGDKLLTLALDAGFNAKPTFNKVVLKRTGLTPSAVRKQEIESRRTR